MTQPATAAEQPGAASNMATTAPGTASRTTGASIASIIAAAQNLFSVIVRSGAYLGTAWWRGRGVQVAIL